MCRHSQRVVLLGSLVLLTIGCEPPAGESDIGEGGGDDAIVDDTPAPDVVTVLDTTSDTARPDAAAPSCTTDGDCPSADSCSKPKCSDDGVCVYAAAPDGAACDDGDACTAGDACLSGICTGKPDPACAGCSSNLDCDPESYCAAPTCGAKGACELRPEACPENYAPVCGCDGKDYGNGCEASAAGQNVDHQGLCECPALNCDAGTEPADGNGDGCADTCVAACDHPCDCYENTALELEGECPFKCLTCGNYWACEAGVCVQHCGPTPDDAQACQGAGGCQSNADCAEGEYCAKKDGSCGGKGACVLLPEVCPLQAEPVCGCDNVTWSNACFAAAAGVNVAHDGMCDTFCGGIAGVPCPEGQWCDPDPGYCNGADIGGSCVVLLDACTKQYQPECGCDGVTYGNACMRRVAQVAKDHDGPCDCDPVECKPGTLATDTDADDCLDSCLPCPQIKCAAGYAPTDTDGDGCTDSCEPSKCGSDADCEEGELCKKESCEAGGGKCASKPQFCTDIYSPVCSCDGKTYSNACEAWAAGQNVASKGECKSTCGTIAGIPCPAGTVCEHPAGSCNASDNAGVCVAQPLGCPDVWDPVCGCDGKTYGNDCDRLMAGVAKSHDGQCSCKVIIDCATGYEPIDSDGDGCADACTAMTCTTDADCGLFGGLYCQKKDGECAENGVCGIQPSVCTKEYVPVCGCDGVTYGNHCMAEAAGANVAHDGPCDVQCGGKQGLQCPEKDQFCEYEPGTCKIEDNLGSCVTIPDGCALVAAPSCGCDGVTYGNDCLRRLAGVSEAHDGACACETNADCPADAYCQQKACGEPGQCAARPSKCTKAYMPVCGCDAKTYGNGCFAASAGVTVASKGECKPDVTTCASSADCNADEYCAKKDGDCTGKGECVARPDLCPLVYDPVCGCDGKTWGNACEAAAAGQPVAHAGTCEKTCGGIVGLPCPGGQWCDPAPGSCNVSDVQGTCVEKPAGCPDVWEPVCGCDGETYGNDCHRQAAQIPRSHYGPCKCPQILCKTGKPVDTDGDGCDDACLPCPLILCGPGTTPVDADGDGCFDSCEKAPCQSNADCGEGLFCAKQSCDGAGVCTPKPQACTQQYDPVCGCDGKTWGNACSAASAGVNVASAGECTQKCGGFIGLPCPEGRYCQMEPGLCGGADFFGTCVPVPEVCPDVWKPVCGCDGKTYGNRCELETAGAQIDHEGECGCLIIIDCAPGSTAVDTDDDGCADACQPIVCKSSAACGADWLYCKKDDCDGTGVCASRPEICTKQYMPVCSCSGQTFGNACEAAAAGQNVAAQGACVSKCGGLAGLSCAPGQVCDYTPGTCGVKGAEGTCVETPGACIKNYQPVCGCDGKTYGNDCLRLQAGVSKASDGPCACKSNEHCVAGSFCAKASCDEAGTCEPKPEACIQLYKPVCGCDGKTWGNACSANAAGVSVKHDGPCEPGVVYCSTTADCEEQGVDGYCAKEAGNCAGKGVCQGKPEGCGSVFQPVCGCDGQTYGSGCEAAATGVNVAHQGACEPVECEHDAHCASGQYCEKDGCSGVGYCADEPEICPLVYKPVCGCDGKTWGNHCEAAGAGVNVAHEGSCEPAGCQDDTQCAEDEYCKRATCNGAGVCAPRPVGCPDVWAAVCGCSGETFGNACEAAAAGDTIAYKGECEPVTVLCKSNAGCPLEGQYCEKEAGGCDGYGACSDMPTACPQVYDPVCGCDGVTYSNACFAAAKGASVAAEGDCEPAISDCKSNEDCGPAEYCQKKDGDCAGAGQCVEQPQLCPLYLQPVCSCGGETFGNGCEAAAAGQNVKHQGACEPAPTGCGGNADCQAGEYCARKPGDCGGKGECQPRPGACPDVWLPVCGCDGETYGNECEAAAAGVTTQYEGECNVVTLCKTGSDCEADEYCQKKEGGCGDTGQCAPRPLVCPDVWAPVCSCSGETFGNSCEAAAAGQSVAKAGKCEPVGCQTNADCADPPGIEASYCAKKAGDCDGQGVCEPRPFICPKIFAPVCGCNGETFGNACEAAATGMNVANDGECVDPGTPCASNTDCAGDRYCAKKTGDCNGGGVCAVRPAACPDVWQPVCSCGAKTYGNACEAAAAGATVAYQGECKQNVVFCDDDTFCLDFELCRYEYGTCGGTGVCYPKPDACYQVHQPVCGCNGKTYGNACEAESAGVSIAHDGACKCPLIICPVGSKPLDTDGDGCPDQCSKVCNVIIDCAEGHWPVDTDGDGCPDSCKAKCGSACDCYDAKLEFPEPCGALCPTCDNYWTCSDAGFCESTCGPVPEESAKCVACEPIACPAPKVASDTDGDGCLDVCICKVLPCPLGSNPVDVDGDGCDDECSCKPIECGDLAQQVDSSGDGCPDTCIPTNCQADAECELSDYFCYKPIGGCGDDSWGKCAPLGSGCAPGQDDTGPVCTCEGMTLPSFCAAIQEGLVVAHLDSCAPVCEPIECPAGGTPTDSDGDGCDDTCKATPCKDNGDCADTAYCNQPLCGAEVTAAGTCEPRPMICPAVFDPVCGCNGKTYSSACAAAAAGISVAAEGPCLDAGGF